MLLNPEDAFEVEKVDKIRHNISLFDKSLHKNISFFSYQQLDIEFIW